MNNEQNNIEKKTSPNITLIIGICIGILVLIFAFVFGKISNNSNDDDYLDSFPGQIGTGTPILDDTTSTNISEESSEEN